MRFPMLINAPERAFMQADRLRVTTTRRKSDLETRIMRARARVARVIPPLTLKATHRAASNVVKGKSPIGRVRLPVGLGLSFRGRMNWTQVGRSRSISAEQLIAKLNNERSDVRFSLEQRGIIRDGLGRYTHISARLTTTS